MDSHIFGRAIVFNSPSLAFAVVGGGHYREIIRPEAVDRTLRDPSSVRALWEHNKKIVLASVKSGTLQLVKTSTSLFVTIKPMLSVRPYVEKVKGGVVGMSFGYRVLEDEWIFDDDSGIVREIFDMEVTEVSIVSQPAYPLARVVL